MKGVSEGLHPLFARVGGLRLVGNGLSSMYGAEGPEWVRRAVRTTPELEFFALEAIIPRMGRVQKMVQYQGDRDRQEEKQKRSRAERVKYD
jgi:hypothetical protein